jgi:hypothetical protein
MLWAKKTTLFEAGTEALLFWVLPLKTAHADDTIILDIIRQPDYRLPLGQPSFYWLKIQYPVILNAVCMKWGEMLGI